MALSNAMRMGKRTLAGVAAGALALGALSIAGATSASAKPNAKPKATATGAVSAVRAGAISSIPYARLSFSKALSKPTTLTIVTSPAGGRMWIDDTAGAQPASTDDSATLTSPRTLSGVVFNNTATIGASDDSTVGIAVDTAGSYTAQLGNGSDTATFTFTTTGAPASMTLTPATSTVLVGGSATLVATLKDASGNATQPAFGDTIAVTASGDDTPSPSSVAATGIYRGTASISVATQSAGTQTITATPQGTLPALGVTAQTATVTASGTVSSTAIVNAQVTAPANAINIPTVAATPNSLTRVVQVPQNSASVTVKIDDTTANAAGTKIRLGFSLDAISVAAGGSLNGVTVTSSDDTQFVDVTTDAAKSASTTLTLGGSALNAGAIITVKQYSVTNAVVGTLAMSIRELAPQVYPSTVTFTPAGPMVAKLGTTTNVSVSVDDSFGNPQSGWTVRANRSSASGVQLSTGTTGTDGVAKLTVTNAATAVNLTTENYYFTAVPPVGTSVVATDNLQIQYTTSGDITSMSVAVSSGTTPIVAGTTTVTNAPIIWVPDDTAAVPYGTSAGSVKLSDASTAVAASGNLATFTTTTIPANAVTVTVDAASGLYLNNYTEDGAPTSWSGGSKTLTASSADVVQVWGTKTGTFDVTIASGGKTVTQKVKVINRAQDAYNLALTPETASVETGSFATFTATVTDYWGNTVAGANVTVDAAGQVLLGGYKATDNLTTGTAGTATVTVIAGNSAGSGTITLTPTAGCTAVTCPAWQATGYTKPTTFTAAPVTSDVSSVTVTTPTPPTTKTISITESGRTTVSGKPGVFANGTTTGFAEGDTLKVWVKFPGQTSYTEGSAKPALDAGGAFEWSRKTGKKTYVYFSNDDESVKSSSVIIPAK